MKPWLLNILACPIDKHHPLEAYFFGWENGGEIERHAADAAGAKPVLKEYHRILRKQLKNGTVYRQAIAAITDLSGNESAESIRTKLLEALTKPELSDGELDLAYRYMNTLEVTEGLLVCPECNRWFPVGCAVESVPELMPDELRDGEKELEWLSKWRARLPERVQGILPKEP